jgi:hypothetical protein
LLENFRREKEKEEGTVVMILIQLIQQDMITISTNTALKFLKAVPAATQQPTREVSLTAYPL